MPLTNLSYISPATNHLPSYCFSAHRLCFPFCCYRWAALTPSWTRSSICTLNLIPYYLQKWRLDSSPLFLPCLFFSFLLENSYQHTTMLWFLSSYKNNSPWTPSSLPYMLDLFSELPSRWRSLFTVCNASLIFFIPPIRLSSLPLYPKPLVKVTDDLYISKSKKSLLSLRFTWLNSSVWYSWSLDPPGGTFFHWLLGDYFGHLSTTLVA